MKSRRKIRVWVVFGGRSGEHEVSIVSARSIVSALDRTRYVPTPIAILKDGRWLAGPKAWDYLDGKRVSASAASRLPKLDGIDVAFPIVHGTNGEDGRLQGLFEMLGVPYVGCDVGASAVGMDKDVQKRLLMQGGIPVAPALTLTEGDWRKDRRAVVRKLRFPLFAKPCRMGSSVGVSKVRSARALDAAVREAFRYDGKILLERAVPDAREIEFAVLGNGPYAVTGPGEIVPSGEFYDFNSKYVDGASEAIIPASLPAQLREAMRAAAGEACRILGVEGMARVDFLLTRGTTRWVLNEINTLPGFTSISMYPKLWLQEGMRYPKLLDSLIKLALKRHEDRARRTTDFASGSDWYKKRA